MAEPSAVYQGNTPSLESGGLNALQLALASYMASGNYQPFGINEAFLETMKTFADPGQLSPFDINERTGLPRVPDLNYTISDGIFYLARGDDMYLLRRAQDCGPDENRLEEVYLGKRPDVAAGTWAFYGAIRGGSVVSGSVGEGWSDGGFAASVPGGFSFGGYDFGLGYGWGDYGDFGNHADLGESSSGNSAGDGPAGAGPGGAKIVCTMMNRLYGFDGISYRNRLWIRWNKLENRDQSWQQAYHKLFIPFVEKMPTSKIIRTVLEDWANTRTQMIEDKLNKKSISKKALMYLVMIRPIVYLTAWGIRKGYIQPVSKERIEKLNTISNKDVK